MKLQIAPPVPQDKAAPSFRRYRGGFIPMIQPMTIQPSPSSVRDYRSIKEIISTPTTTNAGVKKMLWGEPTWFMLHILAEKWQEIELQSLLDTIYTICIHLPCPTCAEHAKQYLNGVNFLGIQSKEQLKQMLFEFHNTVNQRKGYPLFAYDNVEEKYSRAITKNMVQNFMAHYEQKSKSIRLIADDLHRQRLISTLKEWFNTHMYLFAPWLCTTTTKYFNFTMI